MDDTDDVAPPEPDSGTDPTPDQVACFEAGIKFGTLYHQFTGTPITPESAPSLERAMAEAIENQPHCTDVTVDILRDRLEADIDHGYTELAGEFVDVEMRIEHGSRTVHASMAMEDGYPMMRLDAVDE